MTKVNESFEFQCETAKKSFQVHIGSILELERLISEKVAASKTSHICFSKEEAAVIKDWLMQGVTGLSADYTIIERTNKLVNVNNKILSGLLERRTPNLQSLIKA